MPGAPTAGTPLYSSSIASTASSSDVSVSSRANAEGQMGSVKRRIRISVAR
jgi:hypothetical protein